MKMSVLLSLSLAAVTLSAHAIPTLPSPVVYSFSATAGDLTGTGTIDFTDGFASSPDITFTGPGYDETFNKIALTTEPYLLDGYTTLALKSADNSRLILEYPDMIGSPTSVSLCTATTLCTYDKLELVQTGETCQPRHPNVCVPKYTLEEVPTTIYSTVSDPIDLGTGQFTQGVAATPEPDGLVLLGTGALGLIGAARRKLRR